MNYNTLVKLREMKKIIEKYVDECIFANDEYQKFCDSLECKIRANKTLLIDYINIASTETGCKNVILSGGMYEAVTKALSEGEKLDCTLYKISSGLKSYKGKLTCHSNFAFMYRDKDFIFIDDIYYTGKTVECVKDYIKSAGGDVIASYVFFDNSDEEHDFVYSVHKKRKEYDDNKEKNYESSKKDRNDNLHECKWWAEIDDNGYIHLPEEIIGCDEFKIGTRMLITLGINENDEKCIFIEKANEFSDIRMYLDKINLLLESRNDFSNIQTDKICDALYEAAMWIKCAINEE